MRRSRRRRPKVVWMPTTGTAIHNTLEAVQQFHGVIFEDTVQLGQGHTPTIEVPLIVDNDPSETFTGAPLSTWQKSGINQTNEFGYRLRRIVGKCHLAVRNATDNSQDPLPLHGVVATAAFMVRRVEGDTGVAIAPGIDVNAQSIQNIRDPWIWRRTWVLGTQGPPDTAVDNDGNIQGNNWSGSAGWAQFPATTAAYGSIADGPHIDQKTARRVGPEERLFFDLSLQGLPLVLDSVTERGVAVKLVLDYRVLATVYTNAGNRRNASR